MKSQLRTGVVALLDRSCFVDVLDLVHGLIKSARMRKLRRLSQIDPTVMFSGDDVEISRPDKLRIGPGCAFHEKTLLHTEGGLTIGRNVHAGHGLTIFTTNHNYRSQDSIPYACTDIEKPVRIEDFVWLGANVSIIPGVTIGEGAVVAMGAVVTKDVVRGAVVGGNPAQLLACRDLELFDRLKLEGKIH